MIDKKAIDAITDKVRANNQGKHAPDTLDLPPTPLFIQHEIQGEIIEQRPVDGYIDATAMCKRAGKLFGHYRENATTKSFLEELSSDIGIPIPELIQTVRGFSDPKSQGTWVHPQVAINLAQWLSPKFAVQVNKWVIEWISGRVSGNMPSHVRRYVANMSRIPSDHFSMLNELIFSLVAPLEQQGYTLPDRMMPDISTGKLFSNFLRRHNINVDAFPTYLHEFTDESGRRDVSARLYPNKYLGAFRDFFNNEWLPRQALGYFKKKDPKALPFLIKARLLPAPKDKGNR